MNGAKCDGDETITGGRVIACLSQCFDGGRKIAVQGDTATCGKCKGVFPIAASGYRATDHGRPMILDGDKVYCSCGANHVTTSGKPRVWYGHESNALLSSSVSQDEWSPSSDGSRAYDEQFVLCDARSGEPLAGWRYRILSGSGRVIEGTTDALGRTQRIAGSGPETLRLHVEGA
ncbi:PAAR domain-containing protein [Caballeronia sp. GAFFF1]|uniref:PAAR domain-containing protein n=1 Tax=Caballeronia sp. GAFFF1 TaxID=2921779 RepID=UPI002027BF64|nr:PAAR domain-containing protein [Caballeronia sp. GAFFF1]